MGRRLNLVAVGIFTLPIGLDPRLNRIFLKENTSANLDPGNIVTFDPTIDCLLVEAEGLGRSVMVISSLSAP